MFQLPMHKLPVRGLPMRPTQEGKVDSISLIQRIFSTHKHLFEALLVGWTGSREGADDLFQSAYLKASQRAHQLRNHDSAKAWCISILKTTAFDALRQRSLDGKRLSPLTEDLADQLVDDRIGPQSVCNCGLALLEQLTPEEQELIQKIDVEGTSTVKDIASKLMISQNLASVRLKRARRHLRDLVESSCQVETLEACLDCSCDDHTGSDPK